MNINFFEDSYKQDIQILNSLQGLLIKSQIANEFTLDNNLHSLLEQPFVGKSHIIIKEENFNIYTNEELMQIVNDLINEYQELLSLFTKVNEERKILRRNNTSLLQKLFNYEFCDSNSDNDRDFQHFLNKTIFLNYEFLKSYIIKLETKLNKTDLGFQVKNEEILDLKSQIDKLEKKLINSRESFKQYLVNGKTEDFQISSIKPMHSVTTIPISDDLSIGSNEYISQPKKPENSVVKLISNVKLKKKENETLTINHSKTKSSISDFKTSKKIIPKDKTKNSIETKLLKKSSIDFGIKKEEKKKEPTLLNRTNRSYTMLSSSTTDLSKLKKKSETKIPINNNSKILAKKK